MQKAKRDASRSAGQRVGTSTLACSTKTNGTRKESITPGRGGRRPQREERDESVINPGAVATGGEDQRRRTLSR